MLNNITPNKIVETIQTHWQLFLILLVGFFTLVVMAYKWFKESSANRKKAAKSAKDQKAKIKGERSKKSKKRNDTILRWVLSISFLFLVLLIFYMTAWPV